MTIQIDKEITYSVNEIFGPTLQGEGPLIGVPTYFIRFNGCDFKCSWCDSLDAVLPERIAQLQKKLSLNEITAALTELTPGAQWITISGGNPALLSEEKGSALCETLERAGYKIAIETQGSICKDWICRYRVTNLILSPKPPSSGMSFDKDILDRILMRRAQYTALKLNTAIKVVVFPDDARDWDFAYKLYDLYAGAVPFFIQCGTRGKGLGKGEEDHPGGEQMMSDYRVLVDVGLKSGRFPNARFLPQMHLLLFGHGRGV